MRATSRVGTLSEGLPDSSGHVYWDDCGPVAEAVALYSIGRGALTSDAAHAIRARDLAHSPPWFTAGGGNTLSDIYEDVTQLAKCSAQLHGYANPYSQTLAHELFEANVGIYPVIAEVSRAYNLPYSQGGVNYHFVVLLEWLQDGIYVMANGDDVTAVAGQAHPPLRQVTFAQLMNAGFVGAVVITEKGTPMVPTGWKDDGTTLTAPNGQTVVRGFRTYILNSAWDAADVPLAAEIVTSQVEVSDPAKGQGSIQFFTHSQLCWTQATGVFVANAGAEARTLRQQVGALATQVQQLQGYAGDGQALDALAARIATRLHP